MDTNSIASTPDSQSRPLFSSDDVSLSREPLHKARHLPGKYYTSQEVYEMEVEKLFMKDWLVVARVEELENVGDYIATEICGEPIIVCRNSAEAISTFSNICKHRGAEIVPSKPAVVRSDGSPTRDFEEIEVARGNVRSFVCPFHAWGYALDGQLNGVSRSREMEYFDPKTTRLSPIRTEIWGGFVFINFDDDARPLNDYLDDDEMRASADFIQPENFRVVDRFMFEVNCNWKLIPENLIDTYHVQVIHRSTLATPGFAETSLKEIQFTKWGWKKIYPSQSMAPGGEMLFGPAPWLADHPLGAKFAYSAFLRPNLNFLVRADMLQPFVVYPMGPDRCRVVAFTCMWRGAEKLPAFREKSGLLKDYVRKFAAEDLDMLLSTQRGLKSRRFEAGPLHKLEVAIHHRLNTYLNSMQGDGDAR